MNICIDLDKTFLKTDSLYEIFFILVKKNFFKAVFSFFYLLKGRAHFKKFISRSISPDTFPVREEILRFIKENNAGNIYLVTGADQSVADKISVRYPFFHKCYGSNGKTNLTGKNKLDFIMSQIKHPFIYMGDSSVDIPIWKEADEAFYVGDNERLLKKIEKINGNVTHIKTKRSSFIKSILKSMRLHQWMKNLLVFVPLFLSHRYTEIHLIDDFFLGFLSFGFAASSIYIMNDLLDLEADRSHPTKKLRPIPACDISHTHCLICAFLLAVVSISLASFTNLLIIILSYYALNLLYSLYLKNLIIWDVILLASFFTMRIISGHLIGNISISFWLFSFSIFIFLALGTLKRFIELKYTIKKQLPGRGYKQDDVSILFFIAATSALLSSLVIMLYLNSEEIMIKYGNPYLLWGVLPVFIYWILRILLLGNRGEIDEDPVKFVMKDKCSIFILFVLLLIVILARHV